MSTSTITCWWMKKIQSWKNWSKYLDRKHSLILFIFLCQSTEGDAERAVRDAIDAGYRHIDTAFLYGEYRSHIAHSLPVASIRIPQFDEFDMAQTLCWDHQQLIHKAPIPLFDFFYFFRIQETKWKLEMGSDRKSTRESLNEKIFS